MRTVLIITGFVAFGALGLLVVGAFEGSGEFTERQAARADGALVSFRKGRDAFDRGEFVAAAGFFEDAYQADPGFHNALMRAGDSHAARRGYSMAIDFYSRYLVLHPDSPECHEALGEVFFLQANNSRPPERAFLESARTHLEKALGKDPARRDSAVTLAHVLIEFKDYAGAEKALKLALKYHPRSVPVHRARVLLYSRKGDSEAYQKAYAELKKVRNSKN